MEKIRPAEGKTRIKGALPARRSRPVPVMKPSSTTEDTVEYVCPSPATQARSRLIGPGLEKLG